MTGHKVRAKKELDMEKSKRTGKILGRKNNKRDIHRIHTIALSQPYAHMMILLLYSKVE